MRTAKLLAPFFVLALAAAACGGDENPPAAGGGSTTSPPATSSPLNNEGTLDASGMTGFELELDNFYFKPTFIKAKPGQTYKIEVKNEGTVPHTFTMASVGGNLEQVVQPDGTMEVDVGMPAAGGADVAFYCRFHAGQGMRGAFFFGATPSAGGAPSETNRY
jgi:plastocyanin